jgi:hypothetical protein
MSEGYNGFGALAHSQDDHSTMEFIARQLMNGMATAALVEVKGVGEDTVNVQPMVNQIDGAGTGIPHGTIHNLPYFALRAGASAVRAKPKAGDIGVAIFTSSDSSVVKKTKKPANPGTRRRFDWSDGLYLGGFLGPEPTSFIDLDDDVGITVTAASGKALTLNADTVTINGDVSVTGTLTATEDVIADGKSLKSHTHTDPQGGSSGPPS